MIADTIQPATPTLPTTLDHRLAELGITALRLTPRGAADVLVSNGSEMPGAPPGAGQWMENQLIASTPFAAAIRQAWPMLKHHPGKRVELWPGLSLVPLHEGRRRSARSIDSPILAALILGPAFARSERFRAVCDDRRLDAAAAAARIDQARLIPAPEADRLARALGWMHQDTAEIERRLGELQHMSRELAESYEELSLLYKFSTSMTVNQPPENFLSEACSELVQCVGLRWMALQLTDEEPRLLDLGGQVFTAGPIDAASPQTHHLGRSLMAAYHDTDQPAIIADPAKLGIQGLAQHADSLLVVPLRKGDRLLGVLFGADKLDGGALSSIDSKLCDSLSNSLTIFLDNMMLYDDVQAMFLGTLHALTAAIDAKDSYTHGHSERVALMSRQLAQAAGLSEQTVERIYIAGLVHDVGKIGVPEAVLAKPGKLTDHEFELIKMHPEIGGRILADIPQMKDLIPGVMYHHERWDGKGYPHRLAGENIPLFGRVIGLADAFDAMSSNRTYRTALGRSQVLQEIQRCAGQQFDPALAELFVGLAFSDYDQMIQKHQEDQPDTSARRAG